jgi:anthranilate synthase component 2
MNQPILLLDNFDSFTYNLYHLLYSVSGTKPVVMRNDLPNAKVALEFETVVLSPGPGLPQEAGKLMEVVDLCWGKTKILGVCLGHQAIALHSGAQLTQLESVHHGVSRKGKVLNSDSIFKGIDDSFDAGSYHSWTVQKDSLNDSWTILSVDDQGEILAIKHKNLPITGIQFHPESVLTPQGSLIIENCLKH